MLKRRLSILGCVSCVKSYVGRACSAAVRESIPSFKNESRERGETAYLCCSDDGTPTRRTPCTLHIFPLQSLPWDYGLWRLVITMVWEQHRSSSSKGNSNAQQQQQKLFSRTSTNKVYRIATTLWGGVHVPAVTLEGALWYVSSRGESDNISSWTWRCAVCGYILWQQRTIFNINASMAETCRDFARLWRFFFFLLYTLPYH